MTMRSALMTCLTIWLACELSAPNLARAQTKPAVTSGNDVLQRFVGVWDLKSTLKPAKWNPDGGEFTGKESTVWALKNRGEQRRGEQRCQEPNNMCFGDNGS